MTAIKLVGWADPKAKAAAKPKAKAAAKPKAKAAAKPKAIQLIGKVKWDDLDSSTRIESVRKRAVAAPVTQSRQNEQTDTQAFRKWFGQSKVTDKQGRPLVVYHGTRTGGFTQFSREKIDPHHIGFFFTSNREMARTYVGKQEVGDPTPAEDSRPPTLKEALRSWSLHGSVYLYCKKFDPKFIALVKEYWEFQFPHMTQREINKFHKALEKTIRDPASDVRVDPTYSNQLLVYFPASPTQEDNFEILPEVLTLSLREKRELLYAYSMSMVPLDPFSFERDNKIVDSGRPLYSRSSAETIQRFVQQGSSLKSEIAKRRGESAQWMRLLDLLQELEDLESIGEIGMVYRSGSKLFFDPASNKTEASRLLEFVQTGGVNLSSKQGIYEVYLSLQDPLVVNAYGRDWREIAVTVDGRKAKATTDQISYAAKAMGYDGAIIRNVRDDGGHYFGLESGAGDVYIAFEPYQIKSAVANRGTFDPRDPDIRHNPAPLRTFIPPAAVADEARLGLAIRAQQPPSQRCCTPVGLRRASQLANRQPVSVRTLKRMRSYFQRHAVDAQGARWDDPHNPSKGKVAWLIWGGDSGRKWCNSILDKLGE